MGECTDWDFWGSDEPFKSWKKNMILATEQEMKEQKSITGELLEMTLVVSV